MSMHKQKSNGVKFGDLAILAGQIGLVADNEQGREGFVSWLARDQKGAREALISRVEARQFAAAKPAPTPRTMTAAEAQAGRSGESMRYPANWSPRARGAAASVRAATAAGQTLAVVDPQYPPGWLGAAGQTRREGGVSVVVADD